VVSPWRRSRDGAGVTESALTGWSSSGEAWCAPAILIAPASRWSWHDGERAHRGGDRAVRRGAVATDGGGAYRAIWCTVEWSYRCG
jgi:hypothetical protein